jgi:hypothetical protein
MLKILALFDNGTALFQFDLKWAEMYDKFCMAEIEREITTTISRNDY